ncbi:uncharacterized protein LOC131537537 [Onychostoma macrolepis]|uniref:uncharacterized protein LOC131537537 n=1 Tax=Onychostoma macrolepis TaxID=369639 RepID=UPI00272D4667|nr:uncharacterized protein LOC131537537 [Onychostoma macrolepis]
MASISNRGLVPIPSYSNSLVTFNSLLCPPPPPPTTSITADDFATFFTDKTRLISDQFSPPRTQDPQPTTSTAKPPIFSFCPLTEAEVSKLLLSNHPTTCPLDPIPSHLLQAISPTLLPTLTHIINTSLLTGIFPTAFKQARVTPLLKKPTLNTSLIENYRPVSLLPFIAKTLERVVFNQVSLFLSQNNKLDAKQSGCRSGHSTETALLSVTEALRIAKAHSKSSVLILLDLSAAFDTVNHQILLSTLSSLGIAGIPLRWFESYLTDDPTVAARISGCLADISAWMKEHHLQLNLAKTELLVFPATPTLQHDITIQLGSSTITPSTSVRNLGVIFDDQLTFKDHIAKTARSCRFALHNIRKIRPFLTEHAAQLLVQALVISRLDYCNALLAGLPSNTVKPLQMIQNAAARLVFKEPKRAHVTPLFISLHWLPIAARIKFKTLMLAHRTTTVILTVKVDKLSDEKQQDGIQADHVFLLVIKLDSRFTEEEKIIMEWIQENIGEDAAHYTIILFTHVDLLRETLLEEHNKYSPDLQAFTESFGSRYHSFNNEDTENRSQVTELLEKIEKMAERTTQMKSLKPSTNFTALTTCVQFLSRVDVHVVLKELTDTNQLMSCCSS